VRCVTASESRRISTAIDSFRARSRVARRSRLSPTSHQRVLRGLLELVIQPRCVFSGGRSSSSRVSAKNWQEARRSPFRFHPRPLQRRMARLACDRSRHSSRARIQTISGPKRLPRKARFFHIGMSELLNHVHPNCGRSPKRLFEHQGTCVTVAGGTAHSRLTADSFRALQALATIEYVEHPLIGFHLISLVRHPSSADFRPSVVRLLTRALCLLSSFIRLLSSVFCLPSTVNH
jgi:hypothetical protein